MNSVRSYANSYLYTRIPDYEKSVFEFVMKADRIDKNSDAFKGVIEDVKRRQTSAVLSRVLMRDDVVLCINSKPLPAAFKVFAAKDVRTDQSVKVFIDLSGLITLKGGYYVINKIDIFCSYLLSAMTNIIYNENTAKICSNSMIIQSGTECFVNLSSHIFDYLRANGYSENKNKIAYIFAMYFQCTILGLNREDTSVKNLAAKVSGIQSRDINAMELYYDDSVLINIDSLVSCVADTFKMKGVGTDTFVEKWTWFYGVGTQFATELFPAFASMITDAYCGAYVNNQKTIEKCCGRSMVNFTTAMLKVGSDTIEVGFHYESTLDREGYDRNKTVLQEGLSGIKTTDKIYETDYIGSTSNLKKKVKNAVKGLSKSEASSVAKNIYFGATATADKYVLGQLDGYSGMIENTIVAVEPYLNREDKDTVINNLNEAVVSITKMMRNNDPVIKNIDESNKLLAGYKAGLKSLDPDNTMVKEYTIIEDDEDNFLEEIAVAEDGVLICESQKFMGYGGTKKVEKKYNIPTDQCIEREDIMNFKKTDTVAKKAERAVKKIKDPDDVMKYFKSLFKSLCFWGSITSIEQVKVNPTVNKIWKLWNDNYKGNKTINPGPIFLAVENIPPMWSGTVISKTRNKKAQTGNEKMVKGFLSALKPKKKKKK